MHKNQMESQQISDDVKKMLAGLFDAGFFVSMRINESVPYEPQIHIVSAAFGDLIKRSGIALQARYFKKGFSGNDFFSLDKAIMGCLGEAVERTCLYFAKAKNLISDASSNGASAHTSCEEAVYHAICELIERDAGLIFYLNQISPPHFDLENVDDAKITWIVKMFREKNLEYYALDLTTDIGIPVVASLLIDRAGIGPAVVIAGKTDLDLKRAILGSASEAVKIWQARRALRAAGKLSGGRNFWAETSSIKHIEFFTAGEKRKFNAGNPIVLSGKEKLEKVSEYFKKNNIKITVTDITIPEAGQIGFYACKVFAPELQKLYFGEKGKIFAKRVFDVPAALGYFKNPKNIGELNQIMHPFA